MRSGLRLSLSFSKRGFTLIEALTLLFIFTLITSVFYEVFTVGTRHIIESKNRLGATALVNEKMEIVRNLDYDAIGTKRLNQSGVYEYGIPPGDILEEETVTVNTKTFTVNTFVQYVDDTFDGQLPADTVPSDYKRVRIKVSWGDQSTQSVFVVSTFTPQGIEQSTGGGILSLNIIDSQGNGVPQATVHIVNGTTTPSINLTAQTGDDGNMMLPGAPAATQSYQISVEKSGYFPVSTFPSYPTNPFVPIDAHGSVVADTLNQQTVIFDRSSDITIRTKDPAGTSIGSIGFHLLGGRKLGDTAAPATPVYEFDEDASTNSSGEESFSGRSPGLYTFTLTDTSRYTLFRLNPSDTANNNFTASPGVNSLVDAILIDTSQNGVLFTVRDQSAVTIEGASVHVTNSLSGFDETVTTDHYGQAYIPSGSTPLSDGTYDYTVSASGLSDSSGTVSVSGGLVTQDVELNP